MGFPFHGDPTPTGFQSPGAPIPIPRGSHSRYAAPIPWDSHPHPLGFPFPSPGTLSPRTRPPQPSVGLCLPLVHIAPEPLDSGMCRTGHPGHGRSPGLGARPPGGQRTHPAPAPPVPRSGAAAAGQPHSLLLQRVQLSWHRAWCPSGACRGHSPGTAPREPPPLQQRPGFVTRSDTAPSTPSLPCRLPACPVPPTSWQRD